MITEDYKTLSEDEWIDLYTHHSLSSECTIRVFLESSLEKRLNMVMKARGFTIQNSIYSEGQYGFERTCSTEEGCEMIQNLLEGETEVLKIEDKFKILYSNIDEDRIKLILRKEEYLKLIREEEEKIVIEINKLRNL